MIAVGTSILVYAHREDSPTVFQQMVEPLWGHSIGKKDSR
jgi:hypothetical protein